ncbi:MAG: response regulator [Magnetococcales bacterium]|nr:response regulator [Magnetococcales bacterium]
MKPTPPAPPIPGMPLVPLQPTHVAVVDDDEFLSELVTTVLTNYGFRASGCPDTAGFWQLWRKDPPDMIILDLSLPDGNGMDICRDLRAISTVPILILTARSDEIERVVGLEMGADDYLVKPIFPRELVARVKTILRRVGGKEPEPRDTGEGHPNYHFSGWMLATETRQLLAPDGSDFAISEGECRLLVLFLSHPQEILTRERIMEEAGVLEADPQGRSVDNMVSRLRKRLRDTAAQGKIIETVRGEGYRLLANVETSRHSWPLPCGMPQPVAEERTALLLSPDATVAFLLETHLRYFGFTIQATPYSEEALQTVREGRFALIVLDCAGNDTPTRTAMARAVRAAAGKTPVVALAYPEWTRDGTPHPLADEVDELLPLPFRFAGLQLMLSRHMPAISGNLTAGMTCLDLVLISEMKSMAGKQGFLRFLHLMATRLAAWRSELKQAAMNRDAVAVQQVARQLLDFATSVGAQRVATATADLLRRPETPDPSQETLARVDLACELTDTAIASMRMLTQRETT